MTENYTRVCIYRAADAIEGHMVKGLLEGEGLDVEVRGEHLSGALGELPPTDLTVDIYVFPLAESRAKVLVEQYLAHKKSVLPDWICRHCGESNSGHFEICWQCQKEPDESQQP